MNLKKCAVINDLSGFGKCSLAAAMPIISVMGSEVHALPTAVLSNQTAYDSFFQLDLTEYMLRYAEEWKKLGASFDAVLTGFVTSEEQINVIISIISDLKKEGTLLIVDPVMADNGSLYDGYTPAMCKKIRELCYMADIITPNIAELAYIADEPYSESFDKICSYAKKITDKGIKNIVVTGYKEDNMISNIVFSGGKVTVCSAKLTGGYFSGTGDITASIITGGILRGMSLEASTRLATDFIAKVIENTQTENPNEGIEFERFLGDLI